MKKHLKHKQIKQQSSTSTILFVVRMIRMISAGGAPHWQDGRLNNIINIDK